MPVTSDSAGQRAEAFGAPPELVPGIRWRRVLPGEERQLAILRRWLASLLPESPARDDLTAIATELATNAVQHTASGRGGWFAVEISRLEPIVRVAVADGGGPTEPQVIEDPTAEHGRGLLLVRGLSVRTGVCGDHRGRLVWADVRWADSPPAAAAPGDPYEAAIREGETALARRFAGVPAWFGRSTLQWWALPDSCGLVSASSMQELAARLYRLHAERPQRAAASGQPCERAADEQRRTPHGLELHDSLQPESHAHSRRQRTQTGQPRRGRRGDPRWAPDRNPGLAWVS